MNEDLREWALRVSQNAMTWNLADFANATNMDKGGSGPFAEPITMEFFRDFQTLGHCLARLHNYLEILGR